MNAITQQAMNFANGPSVVAVGGGHGQAKSLMAIRQFARSVTAIVSVADDGGSSGRLRDAFAIPAPGDLRKCLAALLPGPTPLGESLEHRFKAGELEGHAFGNLLLAALMETTGDFVGAVAEACRLLDTVGAVWPATIGPVVLCASTEDRRLEGQVKIMGTEGITRVSLEPSTTPPPAAALEAVADAQLIVIGPGSLFTSVLAALAPSALLKEIARSSARKVYVSNLREQVPETSGYNVGDHVAALIAHGVTPDIVLADTTAMAIGVLPNQVELVNARLTGPNGAVHDARRLAGALMELL